MAYHGVLQPMAVAATNIDSLNRSAVCADDVDNGHVVVMGARSTTAGEDEVFSVSKPATGSLSGLWMAWSGDEIVMTASKYKGLDPDPRNFFNAAGDVFSVYKPQLADIILGTAECFAGTYTSGTSTHVNATDAAYGLTWGTSQTSSVLSYALIEESYISLATGGLGDTQRITAYVLECVGL